jgi:methylthioribose-1-phosphate isomerase
LKTEPVVALRYERGVLHVLDQTRLPAEEVWLDLRDAEAVAEAIRSLRVRGAPLIGIAGAYGLAVAASNGAPLDEAAARLRDARPTAVNLGWAIDRVLGVAREATGVVAAVEAEARAIEAFEAGACERIGLLGAGLLRNSARVLTYCNTGSLATGGIGTALGVIRAANSSGKLSHVWVPETRPLLQGARLTAWELGRDQIPFTLVADAAAGSLFARRLVDAVVVGADRIAGNGDTANKVGTYVLAVLAARHDVPFYVAAPTSTIDSSAASGSAIPIEERDPGEVRMIQGRPVAPVEAPVLNPAFDVTPGELVTAIVTEAGIERPPYELRSRGRGL